MSESLERTKKKIQLNRVADANNSEVNWVTIVSQAQSRYLRNVLQLCEVIDGKSNKRLEIQTILTW